MLGGLVGNWIEGILTGVAKRAPLGVVYVRTAAAPPADRLTEISTHGQVESVSTGPDTVTVVPIGPELGDNRRAEVGGHAPAPVPQSSMTAVNATNASTLASRFMMPPPTSGPSTLSGGPVPRTDPTQTLHAVGDDMAVTKSRPASHRFAASATGGFTRAPDARGREIAQRLGRAPPGISRELS